MSKKFAGNCSLKKQYVLSKIINFLACILFLQKPIKIRKNVCELKRHPVRRKGMRHFMVNTLCRGVYEKEPYCKQDTVFLHQKDFVIFDDYFPSLKSGWRYAEIDAYLKNIPKSACLATGMTVKAMEHIPEFDFKGMFSKEISTYDKTGNSVFLYEGSVKSDKPFLAYCIFVNNIFTFELLSKIKMPFVFTLYPGGGMALNNPECDRKLSAAFQSKYFRHVIVTQRVTYDYLIEKKLCPTEKITFIFGVPSLEKMQQEVDASSLKKYGRDKDILDICFTANRYSKCGEDKGYDVFVKMAEKLYRRHKNIRFHVVGNGFDENTLDVSELKPAIHFYGLQSPNFFSIFYRDKDIICSPNKPFVLNFKGGYDGFPLGTSCDAMLQHVACFMSDELKCNQKRYIDKVDAEILSPDADVYAERIEYYVNHPSLLIELAENGAKKARKFYSYEAQIAPRIDLMNRLIENEKASS